MRILVTYESRTGNTRAAAEAIAEQLRTRGADVSLHPMAELVEDQIRSADALVVGTWVQGFIFFGVKPARAALDHVGGWPALDETPTAVFCTYAFNPRGALGQLATALQAKGARVIAQQAVPRKDPSMNATGFADRILAAAPTS